LEAETINYQGVKMVFAISTFKLCFPNKAVLRQILRRIEEKVLNDAKKGVSKFLESFSSQHLKIFQSYILAPTFKNINENQK
jgi:hypothetical protein